jgi:hypothetical protein
LPSSVAATGSTIRVTTFAPAGTGLMPPIVGMSTFVVPASSVKAPAPRVTPMSNVTYNCPTTEMFAESRSYCSVVGPPSGIKLQSGREAAEKHRLEESTVGQLPQVSEVELANDARMTKRRSFACRQIGPRTANR